ncbi:ClpP family protease [Streptomyces sp. NPDC101150]|uniref:ClpP family protease n=1 Tax=Streptomyces sp. NPDC101150 TaxID=3366114 RepID=UPI003813E492
MHPVTHPAAVRPSPPADDPVVQRLLRHRIVRIGHSILSETADRITAQLLLLAAETDEDIFLYITSPGGSVPAGMAIYDTMQHIRNDVVTIASGYCASMAQFLITAGTPGKRCALPNSRMMLHLPSFTPADSRGASGSRPEELQYTRHQITRLLAQHTGQEANQIGEHFISDRWFTATQAKQYGLIDLVLTTPANIVDSLE